MRQGLRSAIVLAGLVLASCAGGDWQDDTGVRPSDPQLVGPRDPNFDRLIVPGERIGPVALGGSVQRAIQHLGQPDRVDRSTFRGPGYFADEVYYHYTADCIRFTWNDSGVNPTIQNGWRTIQVNCPKWATRDGIKVGTHIRDLVARLGTYCPHMRDDGTLMIATKEGIWYYAKDRNSAITRIAVVPRSDNWGGMCKD